MIVRRSAALTLLAHMLQLRGAGGSHGIMMKGCINTTVFGITMHNVGTFFLVDWTGNGNKVSR